ncbi:PspA/IM30 family protein [Pelomonas sp. UHG3]|uniref:PspA/IM30 family protein n=1 Tax=Roseateles hydrophilus TaxID=2975054 RepID=A0ACC6C9R5_9BURK|nr:PspA/IM30 family protein [Pelomonas sp. UHG3]MCY4745176.1 PspA/IM30 family protein [Pelomonas sp. UHG3]
MAESLKTRVGRVMAGGLHALLDKIEDLQPQAAMEQALREAGSVIDEVRHELGSVSANRHLAQQQHARLNASHEDLRDQVDQALAAGRDDLARAAVARQIDIEAQLPVLEATLAELSRQEQELQGFTAALLARQREMQEALAAFRHSRAAAASAAQPAGASAVEQRLTQVSEAFERIYKRQTGLHAAQPGSAAQEAQLRELDDLVREHRIAERLARLKAGEL